VRDFILTIDHSVLPFPPRAQTPVKSSSRRYSDQGASSFHVTSPALKVKLALDKTSKAKTSPFYSIFATPFSGPSSSDLCLHLINRAKDHLIEKYEKKEAEVKSGNLWKYHQARKPYGEPRMIRKSAEEDKDIYCVSDEPGKIRDLQPSRVQSALILRDSNV